MYNKLTVEDVDVKGKKVLVRCDFNVPLDADGNITDENRIVGALPTIKYLIDNGARVILCSHMGKPKGEPVPSLSLAPVAKSLSEKLGKEVVFAADHNVVGDLSLIHILFFEQFFLLVGHGGMEFFFIPTDQLQ